MCDCRFTRKELLVEKQNRLSAAQTSSSSSGDDSREDNVKRLCPHPSVNSSNFLVFCSISQNQASSLISAAEEKSIETEDDLQSLFARCCNPRWYCSECRHPVSCHSSGGFVLTGATSDDESSSNHGSTDSLMASLAKQIEEFITSEEARAKVLMCSSSEDLPATEQKIALAAKAGWDLQKMMDEKYEEQQRHSLKGKVVETTQPTKDKEEQPRVEAEEVKPIVVQEEVTEEDPLAGVEHEHEQEEAKNEPAVEVEKEEPSQTAHEEKQQEEPPVAPSVETEEEQPNVAEANQSIEEEEAASPPVEMDSTQNTNLMTLPAVVKQEEEVEEETVPKTDEKSNEGADDLQSPNPQVPSNEENSAVQQETKDVQGDQGKQHQEPSQPLEDEEAPPPMMSSKERQENEVQLHERTIREQIHSIATRYGMAMKNHQERNGISNSNKFESPCPPQTSRFLSEERHQRAANQNNTNSAIYQNSVQRSNSLSHYPRPPLTSSSSNYSNNPAAERLATISTNGLRGEIAFSIEDALEVSNPYYCDRWTITPTAQLQVHISVFQQTRLGQIFDELQVRIGSWEISSVASRTRQETVVVNDDLLSAGESYVFKKGNDRVYFSVKSGRVGSGSVERAVQGLSEIAVLEDINVERLIAALPMRLQPANALVRRSAFH